MTWRVERKYKKAWGIVHVPSGLTLISMHYQRDAKRLMRLLPDAPEPEPTGATLNAIRDLLVREDVRRVGPLYMFAGEVTP